MKPGFKYSLILAALGCLFFLPFLGGVHLFDWDEINFAEIAREMVVNNDLSRIYVDFIPFNEKPPLFFWMQAFAMKLFGTGEYGARFPNAVCGVITLVLLFHLGRKIYNLRFGLLWAGAYLGSVLPHLYFKSGIIDPWFNLFIFLGLYFFILYRWKRGQLKAGIGDSEKGAFSGISLPKTPLFYLFTGGFIIGFGILTKGPVALLLAGLTIGVYWAFLRFRLFFSIPQVLVYIAAAFLVTGIWYGVETLAHGPKFVVEFTIRQWEIFKRPDAGHVGFPGYHFVVNLIGCFPVSLLALKALWPVKQKQEHHRDFRRWMVVLLCVVLVLFSIVQSKIVHYSSMAYFPLTYLAALAVSHLIDGRMVFNRALKIGLWSVGGIFIFATLVLPWVGQNIELIEPLFSKDPFARANLEADVHWSGWESLAGLWLLGVMIATFVLAKRQQMTRAFATLFLGMAVFVNLTLIFFINNIEGYSQRAAMEFFESKIGEDCYVITHGYRSYGQYFYTQKTHPVYPADPIVSFTENGVIDKHQLKDWMLYGEPDKDVFIVTKIHKAHQLEGRDDLVELYRKNGFVFFHRPLPEY